MGTIQRVVKLNLLSSDNPGLVDGVSSILFIELKIWCFQRLCMVSLLEKLKCEHLKEVCNGCISSFHYYSVNLRWSSSKKCTQFYISRFN